jgi:MFS transporter, DHA2 family, glioxin efflux transporter
MGASSPLLLTMDVENRIDDEKKADALGSDANTMVDKSENEAEKDPGHAAVPEDTLSPDEYPKGLQFVFILLALILSISMVALDLVCLAPVL